MQMCSVYEFKTTSSIYFETKLALYNVANMCVLNCYLQLRAGCISPLKNLRRLGILRIQDFFDNFDWYNFSLDELDAIFQAVVWPQVCL